MAEDRYYYVGPDKKPVGPYSLDKLRSLAARGVVKPTTKAIRKGDKKWVAYSQLATASPTSPTPTSPTPTSPTPAGPARATGTGTHVEGVGYVPKGQFTPEMLDRLNREKAESGEIEIALTWNTSDDLDLHCIDPSGFHISFGNRESPTGGLLDVDMNAFKLFGLAPNYSLEPVEHIRWPEGKAPKGEYHVIVNLFTRRSRGSSPIPFNLAIKANKEVKEFNMTVGDADTYLGGKARVLVHTFRVGP